MSVSAAPADYRIQACMASDIGCLRRTNEDSIAFVCPDDPDLRMRFGVLAVVADGMGACPGGEVASALAVKAIRRSYFMTPADKDRQRTLELAMREANGAIFRAAQADRALTGMGTTATALVLVGSNALVAHVGDSRLYRCTDSLCVQLTDDQTLVARMVKDGLIAAGEARHHPLRSVLLRSLGTQRGLRVDARRLPAAKVGDSFVLCSDGLHAAVEPTEIARIVESTDPEGACQQLIALARKRDGSDNTSVGVIAILAGG